MWHLCNLPKTSSFIIIFFKMNQPIVVASSSNNQHPNLNSFLEPMLDIDLWIYLKNIKEMKGIWTRFGVLECVECKTSMGWISGVCTWECVASKMQHH
jgi:hypothetical protein